MRLCIKEGEEIAHIEPENHPFFIRSSPVLHHHEVDVSGNIIAGSPSGIGFCRKVAGVDLEGMIWVLVNAGD